MGGGVAEIDVIKGGVALGAARQQITPKKRLWKPRDPR